MEQAELSWEVVISGAVTGFVIVAYFLRLWLLSLIETAPLKLLEWASKLRITRRRAHKALKDAPDLDFVSLHQLIEMMIALRLESKADTVEIWLADKPIVVPVGTQSKDCIRVQHEAPDRQFQRMMGTDSAVLELAAIPISVESIHQQGVVNLSVYEIDANTPYRNYLQLRNIKDSVCARLLDPSNNYWGWVALHAYDEDKIKADDRTLLDTTNIISSIIKN